MHAGGYATTRISAVCLPLSAMPLPGPPALESPRLLARGGADDGRRRARGIGARATTDDRRRGNRHGPPRCAWSTKMRPSIELQVLRILVSRQCKHGSCFRAAPRAHTHTNPTSLPRCIRSVRTCLVVPSHGTTQYSTSPHPPISPRRPNLFPHTQTHAQAHAQAQRQAQDHRGGTVGLSSDERVARFRVPGLQSRPCPASPPMCSFCSCDLRHKQDTTSCPLPSALFSLLPSPPTVDLHFNHSHPVQTPPLLPCLLFSYLRVPPSSIRSSRIRSFQEGPSQGNRTGNCMLEAFLAQTKPGPGRPSLLEPLVVFLP